MDTLAVFAALPKCVNRTCVLAAKDYFFKNGAVALGARLVANVIPIDRVQTEKRGLLICLAKLREGKSILMFPEGTRDTAGGGTFKEGAVTISRLARVPIVPAFIRGTAESLPKGRRWPKKVKISLGFGAPVRYWEDPFQAMTASEGAADLKERVGELKQRLLKEGLMNLLTKTKIALTRLAIKTIGRTSNGIQLVTSRGLTSGIMLDYIYRNQPQGSLPIGRWIDKIYLSHPGWEDVRIRKVNLEKYLIAAFEEQRWLGRKPVVLDVAAGAGRYVMDVLEREHDREPAAICRDLDEEVLDLGCRNAAERGIESIKFEIGDALSAESLAEVEPKPNIAVSSGFYDWLNDDQMVKTSMALLYDLLPQGGCFVFTNQCRHVDQEFAQSVFSDLRGQPLRMTMRPAATVNEWAEAAGFKIIQTTGDEATNYSVTLACKP